MGGSDLGNGFPIPHPSNVKQAVSEAGEKRTESWPSRSGDHPCSQYSSHRPTHPGESIWASVPTQLLKQSLAHEYISPLQKGHLDGSLYSKTQSSLLPPAGKMEGRGLRKQSWGLKP